MKKRERIFVGYGSYYYFIICFYNLNEYFLNINMKLNNDLFYIILLMYYKINYVNIKYVIIVWLYVYWIKERMFIYVCIFFFGFIYLFVGVKNIYEK